MEESKYGEFNIMEMEQSEREKEEEFFAEQIEGI